MNNIKNSDMREICDAVRDSVMENVSQNLKKLEPQIVAEIEEKVKLSLENQYNDRISQLESKVRMLEGKLSSTDNGDSMKNNSSVNRIDVSKIYHYFEFNGWIYYSNRKMGDFLYRVREDGTDNTQLTDYSVFLGSCKVSNGYLHFADCDFNDRKIKLI